EKYELKARDYTRADSLAPLVRTVNAVRRRHAELFTLPDVRFHHADDERFLVYSRGHRERGLLLVVVNLDPHEAHDTTARLDLGALGLPFNEPYHVHDELTGDTWEWHGSDAWVRLDPHAGQVAHLFTVSVDGG